METVPDGAPMRWCKGHQCEHPESEFYVKDKTSRRLDTLCIAIRREQKNARYAADPEWHRAQANGLASLAKADPDWVAAKRTEREAIAAEHRQRVVDGARVCTGPCGKLKPKSAFRRKRSKCKACYYAESKLTQPARDLASRLRHPGRRSARARLKYWRNPESARLYKRLQRAKNPQAHVATVRKWQRANPEAHKRLTQRRRAREAGAEGDYTVTEWEAIKAKYDYTCLWCRRREPEIRLSPDHIKPLAKGGTSWPDNIQPLCAMVRINGRRSGCQYRKNAKEFDLRPFWPGPLPEYVELPNGDLFYLRRMPVNAK